VPPAADCHEPGGGSESEDALVAVSSVAAAGSASAGGDSSVAAFPAAAECVGAALTVRSSSEERSEQEEVKRGPAPTPGSALTGLGGGAAKREPGLAPEEAHQSKSNVIVEESGEDDEQMQKGFGRLLKRKTSIAHVGRESVAEPASAAAGTTSDDAGVAAGSADAAVVAALVTDASGPIAGSALASAAVPPAADCHEPGGGSESEDALVAVSSVAAAGSASAAAGGDSSAAVCAAAAERVVAAMSVHSSSEDDAAQEDTRGSDSVGTARWQAAATGASGLASACIAGVVVAVGVGEELPGGSTSGRSPGKILGSSFHEDADGHPMRPADFSLAPGDVEPDTYFEGLDQLDGKPRAEGLQVVGDAEVVLPALCALKEIFDLYRDEAISKEELHILKVVLFRDLGVDLTRLEV